ncbi:MAG: 16S rRNA (guanine(966)-N(2))-methyltransferase RsmD [Eubacteriales bacterium]|nr:16S rRNA (guanine(966)-N(2))-methyltransferase RsmD [Eubacteriales bacterium]
MRVITGKYRGRKLETPEGYEIRPTSDKVREAIFNILMQVTDEAVCCDLFAGTGALGIEALSRGARRCYFGDRSREAIGIVKRNLAHCKAEEDAAVFFGDYHKVLKRIPEKVDIFFLDPPYQAGLYENCLGEIDALDLLAPDGIILAEHETREHLPEILGRFSRVKSRKYGKTSVDLYRWTADPAESTEEQTDSESACDE